MGVKDPLKLNGREQAFLGAGELEESWLLVILVVGLPLRGQRDYRRRLARLPFHAFHFDLSFQKGFISPFLQNALLQAAVGDSSGFPQKLIEIRLVAGTIHIEKPHGFQYIFLQNSSSFYVLSSEDT